MLVRSTFLHRSLYLEVPSLIFFVFVFRPECSKLPFQFAMFALTIAVSNCRLDYYSKKSIKNQCSDICLVFWNRIKHMIL